MINVAQTIKTKNFSIGRIHYLNEDETNFIIEEIFHQNCYLDNFLTLPANSIIFDIGANIGIFSLYALKLCDHKTEIYCFEPIPTTFECLKKNLGYYENVHLVMAGISNVENKTSATFTQFGSSSLTATYRPSEKITSNYKPLLDIDTLMKITSLHNKQYYNLLKNFPFLRPYLVKKYYNAVTKESKVECKLISLGQFIEQHQLNVIDLIKIDVECAELDVMESIKPEQFAKIRQFSIEVNDINQRANKICNLLTKHHYQIQCHENPLFKLPGFNHKMILAKK